VVFHQPRDGRARSWRILIDRTTRPICTPQRHVAGFIGERPQAGIGVRKRRRPPRRDSTFDRGLLRRAMFGFKGFGFERPDKLGFERIGSGGLSPPQARQTQASRPQASRRQVSRCRPFRRPYRRYPRFAGARKPTHTQPPTPPTLPQKVAKRRGPPNVPKATLTTSLVLRIGGSA
jgi:hypothetical protein